MSQWHSSPRKSYDKYICLTSHTTVSKYISTRHNFGCFSSSCCLKRRCVVDQQEKEQLQYQHIPKQHDYDDRNVSLPRQWCCTRQCRCRSRLYAWNTYGGLLPKKESLKVIREICIPHQWTSYWHDVLLCLMQSWDGVRSSNPIRYKSCDLISSTLYLKLGTTIGSFKSWTMLWGQHLWPITLVVSNLTMILLRTCPISIDFSNSAG